MKNSDFNRKFRERLLEKNPTKGDCAELLSDMLQIDKVSAYRRLSGRINFTAEEVARLASKFNISLDAILDEVYDDRQKSMRLEFWEHYGGLNVNMVVEENIAFFEDFVMRPDSEMGLAIDRVASIQAIHHEALFRFLFFKWGHYFTDLPEFRRFDTVTPPARSRTLFERYAELYTHIKYTFYIWDDKIMSNMAGDIKYFRGLGALCAQDVADIKEDMMRMLRKMEEAAAAGRYPATGNRFELYHSSLPIPGSHMYTSAGQAITYHLGAFVIRTLYTAQKDYVEEMKQSINRIKNGAILISGCAEKERMAFFADQRRIVESIDE